MLSEKLHLRRVCFTGEQTFGVLSVASLPRFLTLELPYRDNKRRVSSIPVGTYTWSKFHSPRFGRMVIRIFGVQGRDAIEIHHGNTDEDTTGCILIGQSFAPFGPEMGITGSEKALYELLRMTAEEGEIVIDSFDSGA